ncbi:complex I subunit 4 family protein [Pinibacter soli]|uniref:NADH-quinone oxidoreductase subunit M n=1 Tax=Pinibacter soli TaxID=3044211 RepID=A0ABT6REL6_9BACT|nr:NADH-quinone oxidoreductase subunit M [Pinibacter soli]MDI3320968.1 NADH-quinone oxidoreductase subunit M [Pinibacter soli]
MILVWLIVVLLSGGMLCWLIARWNPMAAKWIALFAVLADLAILMNIWLQYGRGTHTSTDTWMIQYQTAWIPSFGISFHVAIDGLSMILLLLTFFLGTLAVLCSWKEIHNRTGFYYFNLLWTLAGISGVFVALDLFLFYFFWEVMLVPMYLLILIWGDKNRRYAAYKFFIFTQAGGLLMLLSILSLYFTHGAKNGTYSYDYFSLLNTQLEPATAKWIMIGFMIAFVIKLPMVPFHSWLPDAHSEAPTAGSLILAGLLLKTGAYGIIRFVLPLFHQAAVDIAWWAMLFGVIGIIYGAMMAFAQTDIKRLIAYTSVSHMGFVLTGIFAFREIAMQGVVMQIVTHGISTGALFVLAGMIKERLHTRDIEKMGGLWTSMPAMGGVAMLFTMASLGLPVLGNFIAEFLILLGTFQANVLLTVLASTGLVFSALYSLRMMQKVFLGPTTSGDKLTDITARELIILATLSIAIVLLGLYPQTVMDLLSYRLH